MASARALVMRGRGVTLLGALAMVLLLSATAGGAAGSPGVVGARASTSSGGAEGRRLVWSESFRGRSGAQPNPARWSFDSGGGGWGHEELEYYTSRRANAKLDGHGHLAIVARAERYTGPDGVTRNYTSARLQTLHKFQLEYGLIEARIEVPRGSGLLPAFWMLGNDAYHPGGWPASGEIDAMEVLGSEPSVLHGTLHGPWPSLPQGVGASVRYPASLASRFHVYGVEWEPGQISFLLDGSVYETITPARLPPESAWPFAHPFFLLLDLAVGGERPGPPAAATRFPARMLVDWLRVWR